MIQIQGHTVTQRFRHSYGTQRKATHFSLLSFFYPSPIHLTQTKVIPMKKLFFLLLCFSLSLALAGQNSWVNFTYSNHITSLARTGSTWWAGTQGGLVSYDTISHSITLYNRGNSNIPANYIKEVATDDNNDLWIATSHGLGHYDGTRFEVITPENSPLYSDNILSVKNEKGKGIWLATDTALCFYDGSNWTQYTQDDEGNPLDDLSYIYPIGPYGVIFANNNSIKLLNHNDIFQNYNYPGNWVKGIAFDPMNNLTVAGDGGFYVFTSRWDFYNSNNSALSNDDIYDLKTDWKQDLFFLHSNGFSFKTYPDVWDQQTNNHQISIFDNRWTTAIYPDSLGAIGLNEGLLTFCFSEEYEYGYASHFSYGDIVDLSRGPLKSNNVLDVTFYGDKTYVAEQGVAVWNAKNQKTGLYDQGSDAVKFPMILESDAHGRIWSSEINNNLADSPGQFAVINHGRVEELNKDSILGFPISGIDGIQWETRNISHSDTSGRLWISYWGNKYGIAYFNDTSWYTFPNMETPSDFSQFVKDNSGTLWFATEHGIYSFDETKFTSYWDTLHIDATCATRDKQGNLWFGGHDDPGYLGIQGGLIKYDGKTWTRYTVTNSALPDNDVTTIAVDTTGKIWVGTSHGGILTISDNNWQTFNRNNSPLDNNAILRIKVNPVNNDVWIINYGSGIFLYNKNGIQATDVKEETVTSKTIDILNQNYPNPFFQSTTIEYSIPNSFGKTHVTLKIYNLTGQLIEILSDADQMPGTYRYQFKRNKLKAGFYFYQLNLGNLSQKRIMIIRD